MKSSCALLDALSYMLSFFSFLQGEPSRKGQRGLIGLPGQKVENIMRLLLAAYHLFWTFLYYRQKTIFRNYSPHCFSIFSCFLFSIVEKLPRCK